MVDSMALVPGLAAVVYLAFGERRDGIILLVALVPILAWTWCWWWPARLAWRSIASAAVLWAYAAHLGEGVPHACGALPAAWRAVPWLRRRGTWRRAGSD